MAVKSWPRPLRRALYWAVFLVTAAISFAPLLLLAQSARSLSEAQAFQASWSQLLGGYATIITVPIVAVVAVIHFTFVLSAIGISFAERLTREKE